MRSRRRLWRIVALLAVMMLVLAACGDDDDDTEAGGGTDTTEASGGSGGGVECEDVSLAFFGALTGDNANLGVNIMQGAELAVEQFNEENPDCQVGFEKLDSQGSPDQAPALAQQAIGNESIVGIIGPAFSGESRTANPIFDEAGLPLITPSATGIDLSTNGWDVFHRAVGNDNSQGPAAAAYITDELGASKVVVIDDASEYGKGIADVVRDELGDAVAASDSIDPAAQDYSSTVNEIRSADPDVIYYGGYYAEGGRLLKQIRDAGIDATFMSDDGALDPGLVEAAGAAAAEGAIATCPCAPAADIEGGPEFQEAYQEAYGDEAGTYSTEAYDAASVFLEGIKEGNTTRESMLEFLNEVTFEGLTKTLSWDETGEIAEITIYAYKVENGEFAPVGPIGG